VLSNCRLQHANSEIELDLLVLTKVSFITYIIQMNYIMCGQYTLRLIEGHCVNHQLNFYGFFSTLLSSYLRILTYFFSFFF